MEQRITQLSITQRVSIFVAQCLKLPILSHKVEKASIVRTIIWMLQSALWVGAFPFVWVAVFDGATVAGFTPTDIFSYFYIMLIFDYCTVSYVDEEVSTEIFEGTFSRYLIQPISLGRYLFFKHIGFKVVPLMIYAVITCVVVSFALVPLHFPSHIFTWCALLPALVIGHMLQFELKMIVAAAALWLEETSPLRSLYWSLVNFLDGWVGPLVFFPIWLQVCSSWLPWQYSLYAPVMIFLEKYSMSEMIWSIAIALVWVIVLRLLRTWVWRRSLNKYQAVGN